LETTFMRRFAFLAPAVLVLVAACATAQPGAPSQSPVASPIPSPVATPQPTASPTAPPSPGVSPSPAVTPAPSDSPAPAMTKQERKLVALLRPDSAVNCVARRSDLPEGARWAIECSPRGSLVARVGVYRFASGNEAAHAYMTRMASAGVDVNAGNCNRDKPGEEPWVPGDGEADYDDPGVFNWENEALMPERIGCFLNEDGLANVRATCDDAYIGILGKGGDLSDLTDWAWKYPKGAARSIPEPPGICVNVS
jgi:hypothetical protein